MQPCAKLAPPTARASPITKTPSTSARGCLLRVHRSNFEITGFTEQPGLDELVALARRRNLPLMEDLGSGALFDLRSVGINGEPGVLDSLRAGVDIVTYSGDKLLGGPQAGLISGRADLVARMRSNSLFRALRVDKLTYAALEATLLAYVKRDHDAVPVLRMMRLSKDEIARRAEKIVSRSNLPSRNPRTQAGTRRRRVRHRRRRGPVGGLAHATDCADPWRSQRRRTKRPSPRQRLRRSSPASKKGESCSTCAQYFPSRMQFS